MANKPRVVVFDVPADVRILVGPPTQPIGADASAAIAAAVAVTRGVAEAHLPQCYIPSVSDGPRQVLVLVLDNSAKGDNVMSALGPRAPADCA